MIARGWPVFCEPKRGFAVSMWSCWTRGVSLYFSLGAWCAGAVQTLTPSGRIAKLLTFNPCESGLISLPSPQNRTFYVAGAWAYWRPPRLYASYSRSLGLGLFWGCQFHCRNGLRLHSTLPLLPLLPPDQMLRLFPTHSFFSGGFVKADVAEATVETTGMAAPRSNSAERSSEG